MALRGNLKDFSLPDVFQLVTFSKKTGVLRIKRQDDAEGTVWFRDGEVFFASSNWHTEPLGERLVKAQRITPQALARALEIGHSEGGARRLGQILIEEGYITDRVLETFVGDQIQDTIFDLMRWDEGDFDFETMPETVDEDIGLSVSIENIVMEGSRRLEEWNRIKKKIPSMDVVFKMATAPGEGSFEISLKPVEWNILLLTDGTRSVAELAHAIGRTDFEVARIIYGLFSAGLLEFATEEEVERWTAERVEREAKLAVIMAEKHAADAAATAEALERESELEAEAERRAAPEPEAPAAVEEQRPVEEPEFLGGVSLEPTAQDLSVFEEMMGAVLESPLQAEAQSAEPPAPRVEQELPFVGVAEPEEGAPGAFEFDLSGLTEGLLEPTAEQVTPLEPQVGIEEAAEEIPTLEAVAGLEEATAPFEQAEVEFGFEPAAEQVAEPAALLGAEEVAEEFPQIEGLPGVELAAEEFAAPEAAQLGVEEAAELPEAEPELAAPQADELIPVIDFAPVVEPASEGNLAAPGEVFEPVPAPPGEEAPAPPEAQPVFADESELSALLSYDNLQNLELNPPASGDFEQDLMSLGLGEVPPELAEAPTLDQLTPVLGLDVESGESAPSETGAPAAEEPAPAGFDVSAFEAPGTEIDLSELAATLSTTPVETEPAEAPPVETPPDFSDLMQSLDEMETAPPTPELAEIPEAEPEGFDADLLAELAAEEPAHPVEAEVSTGVISTDAYLEDIGGEDMGFSAGLGDELSALTGAERPKVGRPTASVNQIPEPGSNVLHRDQRVDRDTVMKIIDGIKNL